MDKLTAWSFSRLGVFEQCKLHAKLAYIDKIPEPERPLPPGKAEHANDRGTRLHLAAEKFVGGGVELIPELGKYFEPEFLRLRELHAGGNVSLEGEWGYNKDWLPTAWMSEDVWLRVKLDALVRLTQKHAVVIDYKSGRKNGNEVKHMQQGQLYVLASFLRYPDLEEVDVEFWYLDQDEITSMHYTKAQALRFFKHFTDRGLAVTDCVEWPANPGIFNCRWCPYGPWGTGHCKVGVR